MPGFTGTLSLDDIDQLTARRFGTFDVPCPMCGPLRRTVINQRRPVLRVWRTEPHFATFHCARCGEQGSVLDRDRTPADPAKVARARAEAAERDRVHKAERLNKACWLWSARRPIAGTVGETYLREARGYGGPLPATLAFLPSLKEHPPAMIAAFAMVREPECGQLSVSAADVRGVHLTHLRADGLGKAGSDRDKIMIGASVGTPIVLAPMNELLGLAIAEGIEDALTIHQATWLGAWAAGSASRLPALAPVVPTFTDCLSLVVDADDAGRRNAAELRRLLELRGIAVELVSIDHRMPS